MSTPDCALRYLVLVMVDWILVKFLGFIQARACTQALARTQAQTKAQTRVHILDHSQANIQDQTKAIFPDNSPCNLNLYQVLTQKSSFSLTW